MCNYPTHIHKSIDQRFLDREVTYKLIFKYIILSRTKHYFSGTKRDYFVV